jgi:hypothetical protein
MVLTKGIILVIRKLGFTLHYWLSGVYSSLSCIFCSAIAGSAGQIVFKIRRENIHPNEPKQRNAPPIVII